MSSDLQIGVALALGQLAPALRSLVVFGRNAAVGSTEEDVWEGGGTYTFLPAAAALEVVSSSANDASAGTGARTVLVSGLNAAGDEISASVTLNGTTPVAISGTFLRVNGGLVLTSGSVGANVGTITVRTVSGATAQLIIGAARGYQSQFIYTVPRGHNAIVGTFFFSTEQSGGGSPGANSTHLSFYARFNGTNTWLNLAGFASSDNEGTTELRPAPPASVLPALTDFRFAAQCLTTDMRVNCGMTIMLAKHGVSFAPRFSSWAGN